eukprot:CAMPEP_0170482302 /NCGR_PEP_ID=MMETSP0208-20121228/2381_1 /TAXON_ID=197538 /ORGANISM="Strombidium inclinatum, Strain S3" /LENGTH=80 /DNA_ID=CAMNT_0010755129 /DNA_START=245 /DNA_END=487 /DNA_ORIENTATION=+
MDLLQFNCPGCQEEFMYGKVFDHIDKCAEFKASGGKAPNVSASQVAQNRRQTMAAKFSGGNQEAGLPASSVSLPKLIYIF